MANALLHETSPYLLQHAHNPVEWYAWGDEAFEKAKKENKPVLVSIGYATCHWCHVMERESFENDEVAAYMNENFVCIKVDREEHPDVDHFYMDAIMAMQQSGGWPLNMFVTADKQPFYGGTYFPPQRIYNRPSWMEILEAVKLTWQHKQSEIENQTQQLISYLKQTYLYETPNINEKEPINTSDIIANIKKQYDAVYGGFGLAPKFPQFNVLQYLITVAKLKNNNNAKAMAVDTIQKMLSSGIYDVVEGGICRYATDQEWKIPHFEKMLYDNAGLISTLSQVATICDNKLYRNTIEQTIQYCNNTWLKNGLYMSAIDADSEGEEGKYYVWSYNELTSLNAFHQAFADYYALSEDGNWEEGNHILHAHYTDAEIMVKYQFIPRQWQMMKQQFHLELWSKRKQRKAPIVDTKYLLSQNAMMLTALVQAFKSMGNIAYKEQALLLVKEIQAKYINRNDDYIGHLYENRNRKVYAKLDDLAYLLQSYILLFSIDSNADLLNEILWILKYINTHFSDENDLMYYFSDVRQHDVLVRKIEIYDAAIASSNAIMAENLWWIGQIQSQFDYLDRAQRIIATQHDAIRRYPIGLSSYARIALIIKEYGSVVKKNNAVTEFEHNIFYKHYLGAKLLYSSSMKGDESAGMGAFERNFEEDEYQECKNGTCKMPVKSAFQLF